MLSTSCEGGGSSGGHGGVMVSRARPLWSTPPVRTRNPDAIKSQATPGSSEMETGGPSSGMLSPFASCTVSGGGFRGSERSPSGSLGAAMHTRLSPSCSLSLVLSSTGLQTSWDRCSFSSAGLSSSLGSGSGFPEPSCSSLTGLHPGSSCSFGGGRLTRAS